MMARWQGKVALHPRLSGLWTGVATSELPCWLWLCCCGAVSRFQRKVRAALSEAGWENVVVATGRLLLLLMRTTIVHVMKHM